MFARDGKKCGEITVGIDEIISILMKLEACVCVSYGVATDWFRQPGYLSSPDHTVS